MNATKTTGKLITVWLLFLLAGAAAATEHSPAGVTIEEYKNVLRLVERLGARIDALEEQNRILEAGLNQLAEKDRVLERAGAELDKRLASIQVPDVAPPRSEIAAIQAVNDDQSKAIDSLVSRDEALMVAATGLQAQIDNIAPPDLTSIEDALASLDTRQKASESTVSTMKEKIKDHEGAVSELKAKDDALMAATAGLQTRIDDMEIPDTGTIESGMSALKASIEELTEAGKTMRDRIGDLVKLDVPRLSADVDELKRRLAGITRAGDTLRFDAMNIQVTSGTGATDGEVNGLGNVIIGYNETINPFLDGTNPASDKSGSHNLVVGKGHNYAAYGGIVTGLDNVLAGKYGVAAGTRNRALGDFSSVTGGQLNTASGWYASVSGGFSNLASENSASVSGGQLNAATGAASSVGGGFQVRAPGNSNWAAGGLFQQQ